MTPEARIQRLEKVVEELLMALATATSPTPGGMGMGVCLMRLIAALQEEKKENEQARAS